MCEGDLWACLSHFVKSKAQQLLSKHKNRKMEGLPVQQSGRERGEEKRDLSDWGNESDENKLDEIRLDFWIQVNLFLFLCILTEWRNLPLWLFCNQLTNSLRNNISLDESARRDESSLGLDAESHALQNKMSRSYLYFFFWIKENFQSGSSSKSASCLPNTVS